MSNNTIAVDLVNAAKEFADAQEDDDVILADLVVRVEAALDVKDAGRQETLEVCKAYLAAHAVDHLKGNATHEQRAWWVLNAALRKDQA